MKRRLILHLGLWKTGTTTIQTFLRESPDALAAAGIHYPKVGPDNPDHPFFRSDSLTPYLAREISHQALGQEILRRKRDLTGANIDTPLWSTAFQRIDESRARAAIISYEDFSARPELYWFDVLEPRLREFDVLGVIYLRLQEDWATSLYAHLVRGARHTLSFTDFIDSIRGRLAYSTLLDSIRDRVPLDHLVVRNFERAAAEGLLEDFFDRTELPRAPLASATDRRVENRSLPHWAVLFLLKCGRAAPPGEMFAEVRKALIVTVARKKDPPLRPGLDVATPDERRILRDATAADADRLMDRYGITWSAPVRAPMAYRPFDEDDFKAISDVIASQLSQSSREALARL